MISIIIPLYNKALSIGSTIYSVLNQTYKDFEIIIINDGSTDNSVQVVESIKDSRIKLFNKSNGGVSSARNMGIEKATADYIAFLDADDIWHETYLEEQWKLIHDFPDAGMWGCGWAHDMQGIIHEANHKVSIGFRGYVSDYWRKKLYLYWTSAIVVKKSVFRQIEPFDERVKYGEDLDVWYRIILNYPVVFYNKTVAYYRLEAENRAMNKKIAIDTFLPFYIEKYAEYRKRNKDFRQYFDRECLYRIYPFFIENRNDKDVKRIISQIDFSLQKFSLRFRFSFPFLYQLKFIFSKK